MIHTIANALHHFGHMPSYAKAAILLAAVVAVWLAWSVSRHAVWLLSRRNRRTLPWYRQQVEYHEEIASCARPADARDHLRIARQYRWLSRWWWPWAVR